MLSTVDDLNEWSFLGWFIFVCESDREMKEMRIGVEMKHGMKYGL